MKYLNRVCEIAGLKPKDLTQSIVKSVEDHFFDDLEELWLEYYEYKIGLAIPGVPEKLAQALSYYWYGMGISGKFFDVNGELVPVLHEVRNVIPDFFTYYTFVLYNYRTEKIILTDITGEVEFIIPLPEIMENLELKNMEFFFNLVVEHLDKEGNLNMKNVNLLA